MPAILLSCVKSDGREEMGRSALMLPRRKFSAENYVVVLDNRLRSLDFEKQLELVHNLVHYHL